MGKYDHILPSHNNGKEWVLQQIANELAESNRLKRLELDLEYSHTISEEGIRNLLNEIHEDQG